MNSPYDTKIPRGDACDDDVLSTSPSSESDTNNDEGENEREDRNSGEAEVTALCWSGASVGVARYLCAECRIEVFEAPVCVVAGEAVRRRSSGYKLVNDQNTTSFSRGGNGGDGGGGEVRILVYEDVPPSLLWLVRYLEVHQPQVLLPHTGCEALSDLVCLVAAHTPLEVMQLSATTAFNASEALPRLAAMYPAQEAELTNRFHVENTAMMRAMAALLHFVAAGQSNVADVVERGVLHALYLEDACAEALQITRTERHPSSAQGCGRAKEGLSLRGLLSTTLSSLGRLMLRQWIALPCCDVAEIAARQSVVAFFAHVEHHTLAGQLRAALNHVRSTSHIFTTMRWGRALRRHYVSLYRTIRGMIQVQRLLSTVAHEVSRLYVLLQSVAVEPLISMAEALARTVVGVAPAHTTMQNRVVSCTTAVAPLSSDSNSRTAVHICDGVDGVLDELRLRLHELRLSLQSKAEAAFVQLPSELRVRLSLRCVYAAPHGYLLCVPSVELMAVMCEYVPGGVSEAGAVAEEDGVVDGEESTSGSENDRQMLRTENTAEFDSDPSSLEEQRESNSRAALPTSSTIHTAAANPAANTRERIFCFMLDAFGWQFHHESEAGEYCFKSSVMEELDTWVGDLQRRVQQREQQVLRMLDTSLLYNSLLLLRPTRALGELDCLLSFAYVSAQEGWCRPEILSTKEVPSLKSAEDDGSQVVQSSAVDGGVGIDDEGEEEGVLEIDNGWHPLLSRQLGLQQLVPFSLHLRTSTDRVCVILGVNGSGKSVLLNAVAHIVFLAHVGCHVPAAAARMSPISGIFAPSSFCSSFAVHSLIASARGGLSCPSYDAFSSAETGSVAAFQEQAEAAQSSFYGECVALHRVLHHVAGQQRFPTGAAAGSSRAPSSSALSFDRTAGRALVLLDEFGRGTAPEDGCALLKGTLRFFATGGGEENAMNAGIGAPLLTSSSRWRRAPLVFCATHLVEVFDGTVDEKTQSRAAEDAGTAPVGGSAQSEAGAAKAILGNQQNTLFVGASPSMGLNGKQKDLPLPLEWIKIYHMETLTTYAPDDSDRGGNANYGGNLNSVTNSLCAPNTARCAPGRLPVDVTPTYLPVCVTPHTGEGRWDDWRRLALAHLNAGPALGRQCGLDAGLLTYWESALRVLHSSA